MQGLRLVDHCKKEESRNNLIRKTVFCRKINCYVY